MKQFQVDDKFNISGRGIIFAGVFSKEERNYLNSVRNKDITVEFELNFTSYKCRVKGIEMFRRDYDKEIAHAGILVEILANEN